MRPDKPTLSAVIPTLDEEAKLADAIMNLRAAGFDEIIVSDGGSADATRDIASSFEDVCLVSTTRGRGQQLAAGVAAATSPLVAMVHADCRLPGDAGEAIRRIAADGSVVGGCFRIAFDQPGVFMSLYGWFSRLDTPFTTFGDQVIFARRDVLIETGGVPEIHLFEDVVLRKRLRRAGRFVKLRQTVLASARHYRRHGIVATQALNGLLLAAFLAGWPAGSLYRFYYGVRAGPVDRHGHGSHSPGGSNPSVS